MLLSDVSLKRPVFATITLVALVVLGFMNFFKLPVEEYPPMEFPYVAVQLIQPGASPEVLQKKVVKKVEDSIAEISGVKHIYAEVSEGSAFVYAEFTLDTKADKAAQDVRDKMGSIRGDLPDDLKEPVVMQFKMNEIPILSIVVKGDKSIRELTRLTDDIVKKRISAVNGVGSIKVSGSQEREIKVYLDLDKLNAYGLTASDVTNALRSENMGFPAGSIDEGNTTISLKTSGEIESTKGFVNLPVAHKNGIVIYLGDVARVEDGIKKVESLSRYQGKNAISIDILKQSGKNTVEVTDNIKKALDEARAQLPAGVDIEIVKDTSVNIRNAVSNVLHSLIEGGVLAVVIVFIFLKNVRTTLISAVAIPTSIITTFLVMKIMGFSLNTMSLGALSLCVGLLIDDAIVVIENIERHRQMGKGALAAAKDATSEIGLAVMATTFAIVAVFLPIGMMTGIIGQYFRQFGITAVAAVLMSLVVSFTLVPLLSSRHLGSEEEVHWPGIGKLLHKFNEWFDGLSNTYEKVLRYVLKRRWRTVALAVGIFVLSLFMIPMLGSEFMASSDIGEINISATMDEGTSLQGADNIAKQMEARLSKFKGIKQLYVTIQPSSASVFIKLVPRSERDLGVKDVAQQMRRALHDIPGVQTAVSTGGDAGGGGGKPFELSILGDDMGKLRVYGEQLQKIVQSVPGAADVSMSYRPGKPQDSIVINRDKANDLGVSTAVAGSVLQTLYTGTVVNQYEDGDSRSDVRVQLEPDQRKSINVLDRVYVSSSAGGDSKNVPLSSVVDVKFEPSAGYIKRLDRQMQVTVSANVENVSIGKFNEAVMAKVGKDLKLSEGYTTYSGGMADMMAETFGSMGLAIMTGIMFIFFVLAAQFESYIDPLSIMLALPMALIGAIGGLLIMNSNLSIDSMIGILLLMGLVTKNAILLIDFIKHRRACGIDRAEAIVEAGKVRLRPIIMTTLAMIFGMVPMALALGEGAEARAPMAYTIIGGLITSTILTLVVVPVIYTLFDDLKNKFRKGKFAHAFDIDEDQVCAGKHVDSQTAEVQQ